MVKFSMVDIRNWLVGSLKYLRSLKLSLESHQTEQKGFCKLDRAKVFLQSMIDGIPMVGLVDNCIEELQLVELLFGLEAEPLKLHYSSLEYLPVPSMD
jgi:hypothetical protein